MLVDKIQKYLESKPRDERGNRPTMSALGKCGRAQAYKFHDVKGIPLDHKAIAIFETGDMFHDQIRGWLKGALEGDCFSIERLEEQVSITTPNGNEVRGHIDAFLKHDISVCLYLENPDHDDMLLEIKSMGEYAYKKFAVNPVPDDGYHKQMLGYMKGLDVTKGLMLAESKSSSDMSECLVDFDDAPLQERLVVIDKVLASKKPEDVPKEYEPEKKRVKVDGKWTERIGVPWQCCYCPYWAECWKERKPYEDGRKKIYFKA